MRIDARAYAKINWLLEVGGLRPDRYHELLTIFQTIDLYDELSFQRAATLSLTLAQPDPSGMLQADESNLVLRAARALATRLTAANRVTGDQAEQLGAEIRLRKLIPIGGGLGGGSSDAATTLVALNELWQGKLSHAELAEIGGQLGADIPFFLTGGTAWGTGRGTEIREANDIAAPYLLLVNPGVNVPTPLVYREFDRRESDRQATGNSGLTSEKPANILPTCSFLTTDMLFAEVRNSLAAVASTLFPVIASVERQLLELGGNPVLMSGSGATVWARFDSQAKLDQAATELAASEWLVIKTRAIARAEYWRTIVNVVV